MTPEAAVPSVTVRRKIEAPAEVVFDAWLDPSLLALWMKPAGFSRTAARVDAREGGAFEVVMYGAAESFRHTGVYRSIDRPRRLVFTWMSPATRQEESLVTVEFRTEGRSTEIVLTHERLPDAEAVASHTDGWSQALRLLAGELGARED